MPRVTSLDGKVYELDEETLERCRIPDEDVEKLGQMPPLPPPPAEPRPMAGSAGRDVVRIRRGPGGSTLIDITPPKN